MPEHLRYLFIVSQVTCSEAPAMAPVAFRLKSKKRTGTKCERCWNYSTRVGEDQAYPTICERCSAALKELEAPRS